MKPPSFKVIASDRFLLVVALLSLVILSITAITYFSARNLERRNRTLKKSIHEIESLRENVLNLKGIVESKEKKIGLTEVKGIVPVLEQMINDLNIKAKAIKPLGRRTLGEFSEEEAELQVEGIDLNRIVNLLYRIENSPIPLKITDTSITSTFENPEQFFLHLTVSLMGK